MNGAAETGAREHMRKFHLAFMVNAISDRVEQLLHVKC